jgi:hypothetical protein
MKNKITHLEEVLKKFRKEILDINIGTDWGICPSQVVAIETFIINSHIKYLEKDRFVETFKTWVQMNKPSLNEILDYLEEEISHKQQELLQAKELLK